MQCQKTWLYGTSTVKTTDITGTEHHIFKKNLLIEILSSSHFQKTLEKNAIWNPLLKFSINLLENKLKMTLNGI